MAKVLFGVSELIQWFLIAENMDAVQHDFDVSPIGFRKDEIPYTGKL